jgi:hypothetical protein
MKSTAGSAAGGTARRELRQFEEGPSCSVLLEEASISRPTSANWLTDFAEDIWSQTMQQSIHMNDLIA